MCVVYCDKLYKTLLTACGKIKFTSQTEYSTYTHCNYTRKNTDIGYSVCNVILRYRIIFTCYAICMQKESKFSHSHLILDSKHMIQFPETAMEGDVTAAL